MSKGTEAGKCSVIRNDHDVGSMAREGGSRLTVCTEARANALCVAFRLTPAARGSTQSDRGWEGVVLNKGLPPPALGFGTMVAVACGQYLRRGRHWPKLSGKPPIATVQVK